jgi:hypothetical protein
VGKWWAKQNECGTPSGGDVGRADVAPDGGFIDPRAGRRRRRPLRAEPVAEPDEQVLDLDSGWAPAPDAEELTAEELAARFRARAARAEAERDLIRLRQRHWSGERIIEEGQREIEWWEHPEADPYAVLGLIPGATIEEVSAARRKVAQRCHPDQLGPDADYDDAVRRMVAANSAYDRIRRALHPV